MDFCASTGGFQHVSTNNSLVSKSENKNLKDKTGVLTIANVVVLHHFLKKALTCCQQQKRDRNQAI